MFNFSLSGKDQKIIIFAAGFILLLNATLFFLPYILPPANYMVDKENGSELIFESPDYELNEIRYSDRFAYILSGNALMLYKIDLHDKSITKFHLSDFIDTELLNNIHITNVNDEGVYLSHAHYYGGLRSGTTDQYFSYITDHGLEFSYYTFTGMVNHVNTSQPYAISFSIGGKEVLAYWNFMTQEYCEIQFYEVNQENEISMFHRQSLLNESQNTCANVQSISKLEDTLIISTSDIIQDYETVYQFDPKTKNFERYTPFVQFTSRAEQIFTNQADTYGYQGYFFVGGKMYVLAVWNDNLFVDMTDEPPVRYLDVLDSNFNLVSRLDFYEILGNRSSYRFLQGEYWFTTQFFEYNSYIADFMPLEHYQQGRSTQILGFTDWRSQGEKISLIYFNMNNSTLSYQRLNLTTPDMDPMSLDQLHIRGKEVYCFILSNSNGVLYNQLLVSEIKPTNLSAKYEELTSLKKYGTPNLIALIILIPILLRLRKRYSSDLYPEQLR